jgi:hypothetical protein
MPPLGEATEWGHPASPEECIHSKGKANEYFVVNSERGLIVQKSPIGQFYLQDQLHGVNRAATATASAQKTRINDALDWLEQFTCLCSMVDVHEGKRSNERVDAAVSKHSSGDKSVSPIQHRKDTKSMEHQTVYPIAKYPGGRLNSPYLVEKRRRSLKSLSTFQPVVESE